MARFAKALEESYCWFSKPDNFDQVVALMQKYVKVPDLPDDAFKAMVKGLLPTFGPEITPRTIDNWSKLLVDNKQLGAPKFIGVVMALLSRKIRKQARKLDVNYSFLFMQANGGQLRELARLYDAGHLRPLIDTTFPFEQTLEALAYVDQGRANGKVVITLD